MALEPMALEPMAEPGTPAARRRRRARTRRILVSAIVVVVGLGTGIGVARAQASDTPGYRTATATTGSTTSEVAISGTVEPVNQAAAAFQVGGTVSSVKVTPGQHVSAGQTLATLDPTSLQEQVSLAEASLSSAQAKLSEDESGESSTSAQTASSVTSSVTSVSGAQPAVLLTAATVPTSSGGSLLQAQRAVVSAQHTADLDIQTATADLASAERTCGVSSGSQTTLPRARTTAATTTLVLTADVSSDSTTTTAPSTTTTTPTTAPSTPTTAPSTTTTTPTTTPSTTPTTTPSTTPTTTPSTTPTTTPGSTATSCATALQQAMAAQQQVSQDQQAVQSAETTLAQMLSKSASSTSNRTSGPSSTGTSAGRSSSDFSSSGSSGASGSSTPTAAATNSASQLASDQASIDSEQASLVSAEQALNNATLTAPMAGTVAAVGISEGDTVSAGSSSATITVTDPESYETTSSLTSSQVGEIKVGDSVQVDIDGQAGMSRGTVTRVGPVQSSSTGYTYPLIVSLAAGSVPANSAVVGASAQLNVELSRAANSVVVPTSAIHTSAVGDSYVVVLQAGKESRRTVKVGVVGTVYTQITSGLAAGARVVLADPSQAVPSSNTNSSTNVRGFGVGGAGAFPAGGVGAISRAVAGG
jgi:trimeric autotransporter adhesin